MKKTTLLLTLLIFTYSAWAQDITTVKTYTGTINEVNTYANGIVFTGTNASNDQVVLSPNGTDFYTVDAALVSGTSSLLEGWKGHNKTFYHGDDNGGLGTELRIFDGSSAKKLIQNGQGDVLQDASILSQVSAPVSYFDGSKTVTKYFYLISTAGVGVTNMHLVETDGTDFNTLPVANGDAQIGMIMPYDFSYLEYVYFKNKLFLIANYGTNRKSYAAIYTYDYQTANATNDVFYMGKETESFTNLMATDDYLYIIDSNQGGMLVFDEFGAKQPAMSIPFSSNIKPHVYNNRVFAVTTWDNWNKTNDKLVYIDGVTPVQINVNDASETDAVENIVLSDDKLFFVATPSGGNPSLYVVGADVENPTPLLIEDADFANYQITGVQAIEGGVVYTLYNPSLSPKTKIKKTNGTSLSTFITKDDAEPMEEITHVVINENAAFFIETTNTGESNVLHMDLSTPASIGDNGIQDFTVSPNPCTDFVNIQSQSSVMHVTLLYLSGKKVYEQESKDVKILNVSSLSEGVYLLVATDSNGQQVTKKIIKK